MGILPGKEETHMDMGRLLEVSGKKLWATLELFDRWGVREGHFEKLRHNDGNNDYALRVKKALLGEKGCPKGKGCSAIDFMDLRSMKEMPEPIECSVSETELLHSLVVTYRCKICGYAERHGAGP